jgi:hypothetical protein
MSFLSTNNSEFLSARITQKGRNAIAKGSFNINYFQIGDSEYDYNLIFSGLTGNTNHQMVMSPFDREAGIKYPYKIDSSTSGTTYGVPVNNNLSPESIRNVIGPAGFVTESDTSIIKTYTELHPLTTITGGTLIPVTSGNSFNETDTITIAFTTFGGEDINNPVITGNSTSLVYKIIGITGNTIEVDRELPTFPSPQFDNYNFQIVANYAELEYPLTGTTCPQPTIDNLHQHNPWTLDVVWDNLRPIGTNNTGSENSISGYTSNKHLSTKEYLGYSTNSAQTFTDLTGGTVTYPTSYKNSFDEIINVTPEEQRSIAIIHYSELGDLINDPERFYKYDDYISTLTTNPIYLDADENEVTDAEYFEVYIPFVHYHRHIHTGSTIGALFTMDSTDYYVNSTINSRHKLLFRYLLDLEGNRVGKVFPNNKIVVFDDQELVAILDFRSNRRYTLPAPKLSLINSDTNTALFETTGQTLWFTYALSNQNDTINGLPCNYYSKIDSTSTPSNIGFKFNGDEFHFIGDDFTDFTTGFTVQNFYILLQITNTGDLPSSELWSYIDYTDRVGGDGISYINPTGLTGTTFTITYEDYEGPGRIPFNLDDIMGVNYTSLSNIQFGEEQTFPGSIRLVRSSDIETLNFLVNLPSTQFTETQNPTYVPTAEKRITEIALLDTNKEVLVIAKTPIPIKRIGTQVFSLKLDF